MAKKKVSQIAKEMGVSNKELIETLHKLKISAKKASDYVTEEETDKVLNLLTSAPPQEKVSGKTGTGKTKAKTVKPLATPKKKEPELVKPKPAAKEKIEKVKKVEKVEKIKKVGKAKAKPKAPPKVKAPAKPEAPQGAAVIPEPKVVKKAEKIVAPPAKPPLRRAPAPSLNLKPRPPIVTVMGHVDHGKTTLLDTIRQTNVAGKEAGQITQHIGAYEVDVKAGNTAGKITFLDTPGHEAFTAMRARGTQVTDIVVLVVGADDGVMPQTVEAIDHARAAEVPIIVAINKVDKETANPDQIKQQLSNYKLISEEWGGETICLPISALKKTGIDHLLEMILIQSEMMELKADPTVPAKGTVIEARLDRHTGPVATIIVKEGTLRVGDPFIIGIFDGESSVPTSQCCIGKVRALINDKGLRIEQALPSTPVEVLGLESVPQAGEVLQVIADKKILKEIEERKKGMSTLVPPTRRLTLEDLYKQVKEGEVKELRIVIKGDVQGSIEAIIKGLEKIGSDEVKLQIIHKGVGDITEADIMLASASKAIVVGFNVNINPNAKKVAQYEEVDVRLYKIIYELLSDMKKAKEGEIPPKFEEVLIGRVEITTIFKVSKVGAVAGCRVTDGKVTRDARVKLLRKGTVIYEGKISSLKRFKEDAKEVEKGFECGLALDKFNDIKEGDIVEAHAMQQVK